MTDCQVRFNDDLRSTASIRKPGLVNRLDDMECAMKSTVVKRSIEIAGRKTSVSLEDAFWNGLKEIAEARRVTLSDVVAAIDSRRQHSNLSSAIRLFVLDSYHTRVPGKVESHSEPASPPLVPSIEVDVLLVLCELGKRGATYIETDPADANEDTIVRNMIEGQYGNVLRVISINIGQGWARDVSNKIARTILKEADRQRRGLPRSTWAFVTAQLGSAIRH